MKQLKNYLERKKLEKKFKTLGHGYSLAEENENLQAMSHTSQAAAAEARAKAAEAVEKRLNQGKSEMNFSQRAVYFRAKKELEEEQQRLKENQTYEKHESSPRKTVNNEDNETTSICYTCDLLDGVILPKTEMYKAIENFLREQLQDEGIDASVLMIYSLNPKSKVDMAIPIIQKYLENIMKNPNEQKFSRIRKTNKVFSEKVEPIKGAIEFLNAVGFVENDSINETTGEIESFLVMLEPNINFISEALKVLQNENIITLKFYRNPKVYSINPSKPIPRPNIPPDFYSLTPLEIKNMQEARTREVELMTTLRTSKMREMSASLSGNQSNYKYTIIRIRFPNNFLLEGTFNVHEKVFSVREFVSNHLEYEQGMFFLSASAGNKSTFNEEKSFLECSLVPTALIHFEWYDETLAFFNSQEAQPTYLNRKLEMTAELLQ